MSDHVNSLVSRRQLSGLLDHRYERQVDGAITRHNLTERKGVMFCTGKIFPNRYS